MGSTKPVLCAVGQPLAADQRCRVGNLPEALVSLESLGQIPWLEKSLSPGNVSAGGRSGVGVTEKSTLFECFFFFFSREISKQSSFVSKCLFPR